MKTKQRSNQKWCSTCSIWIADNKAQREQHENGTRHKNNLAKQLREIAEKNEEARRVEQKLQRFSGEGRSSGRAVQELLEKAYGSRETEKVFIEKDDRNPEEAEKTAELVDGNGYPLPADEVYGGWETVEEDAEQIASNEANIVENPEASVKSVSASDSEGTSDREATAADTTGAKESVDAAQAAGLFKRRKPQASRSKRRKR